MERRIVVSGGNELRVFSLPDLCLKERIHLEGAGAMAACADALFCACNPDGIIWRLSVDTLVPQALFAGGPGVCALALSPDGGRLYALCGEGDSVLMIDARSGLPMLLSCVGFGPRSLSLCGNTLAVAGGESGTVCLLRADTLSLHAQLPMPGPVYDAALCGGCVHALCLSETLSSYLVSSAGDGSVHRAELPGMPGVLLPACGRLLAATHGRLFTYSSDGERCLKTRDAAGRAGRLLLVQKRLLLCDTLSEMLFALEPDSGRWRPVCAHACDVIGI